MLLLDNLTSSFCLLPAQVSLFKGWVNAWSDDLKSYLLLRLKVSMKNINRYEVQILQEIDQTFSKKYEHFLEFGKDSPERVSLDCYRILVLICGHQDYFEPGVPPELDLSLDRSSTGSMDRVEVSLTADDRFYKKIVT